MSPLRWLQAASLVAEFGLLLAGLLAFQSTVLLALLGLAIAAGQRAGGIPSTLLLGWAGSLVAAGILSLLSSALDRRLALDGRSALLTETPFEGPALAGRGRRAR